MCDDLKNAVSLLESGNHTCVFYQGQAFWTDDRRGIRPLLELLESDQDVAGFSAADRVVGKAAAFLYCLLGVHSVYAKVISTPALQVLQSCGIDTYYDTQVNAIRNRTGDGFCPMETAVWNLNSPEKAPDAIREALRKL